MSDTFSATTFVTADDGRKLRIIFRDKGYAQPVPTVLEYNEELGIYVHVRESCEVSARVGIPCCLHNPSDHHMRSWPMVFRYDRGIMERTCPHGTGHPDPDDAAFRLWLYNNFEVEYDSGVHGCDLCCGCKTSQALAIEREKWAKLDTILPAQLLGDISSSDEGWARS